MGSATGVRIRMYRHGLGDCFLLRFEFDGGRKFNVLIDCGIAMVAQDPRTEMAKVVQDIKATCPHGLDVVVMTHEHWDHVSGFSIQQVQDEFKGIEIREVWYAWTEDPKSELGAKLRKEREAKVKALATAVQALRSEGSAVSIERADRAESLLQFFGLDSATPVAAGESPIGKTRAAYSYLAQRSDVKVRYCYPDMPPLSPKGLEGMRVYVLGPPQDERMIKKSDPTKAGKEVYDFAADTAVDENLGMAFERLGGGGSSNSDQPFDASWGQLSGNSERLTALQQETWDQSSMRFRRIDLDWTASAETLALDLDKHTNNTCLVLAFEHVASGKVMLFPADAQVGNWLSWQDLSWRVPTNGGTQKVTGPDLLRRTVFYKVGHHGSHNATLRALGLEQMTSDELVAFVPVFEEQAKKSRWKEMPFDPLVKRLNQKTGGRVVVSDDQKQMPKKEDLAHLTEKDSAAFLKAIRSDQNNLFYEYALPLSDPVQEGASMAMQQQPVQPPVSQPGAVGVTIDPRLRVSIPPPERIPLLVELKPAGVDAFMGFGFGVGTPLDIDPSFAPVSMSAPRPDEAFAMNNLGVKAEQETRIIRAFVQPEQVEEVARRPEVVAVWADPQIEPILIDCTPNVPTGTSNDVAIGLQVDHVWNQAGTRGEGIVIGIVDGGVNGSIHPVRGGWSPDPSNPPGSANVVWGGHGNMCAHDARIACPDAGIFDYAIGRASSPMSVFLSAALQAFQAALVTYRENRYPQVLSNSWGLYQQSWDPFPPGDPRNYSHNLAHPFMRKVVEVMDAGILVSFAAGNCGQSCPDQRCGPDVGPGRSIRGANGHPRVICVGAVNLRDEWIGYSSQGPSTLDPQKPDICSYSHFVGQTPCDNGTSAACPVVAGVLGILAAARPGLTQDRARVALQKTARLRTGAWKQDLGWGIVDALRAYQLPP